MPYIAASPEHYQGKRVGSGESVAFVQAAAGAPSTGIWTAGVRVMRASPGTIAKGTVIATMVDGQYSSTGNHAAIYLGHDMGGIQVMDQWVGQAVQNRLITPNAGQGGASNDADAFYVVE